jgi:7-alpha-hydroxysteroid dehydrogenase
MEHFRMDGRVALVSGASRGIGAAIAIAFAEAGADVAIGARDAEALGRVAEAIEGHGRRAVVHPGSLHSREHLSDFVHAAIAGLGPVTTLVNNVGGSMPMPFLSTTEEDFDGALRWNVTTAFNLSQLVVPHMLDAGGGTIVNISSAAGRHATRGFVAYGTAKAAMIQLTRTMAADLAPRIRVNSIAPGAILTDALASVLNDDLRALMEAGTPMRRIGVVDDIAAAAVYLASPASSYVTGQVLPVDGGIQDSNFDMGITDL